MDFFKSFTNSNIHSSIKSALNEAAFDLYGDLKKLNIEELDVSDYSKNYFKNYQNKLIYSLECACFIIANALNNLKGNFKDAAFADHGAGLGMICLLAKKAGIKNVIYNDIYDVSTQDAKTIATKLNLLADEYFCGEMEQFVQLINHKYPSLNAFVSRNVIEHIYNLDEFFFQLAKINSLELVVFIATTANEKNILVDQYTKKLQRKAEFEFNSGKWGKNRDSKKPYSLIRKEILQSEFPQLQRKELMQLVISTRGLIKEDIIKVANEYVSNGVFPPEPKHPSNTCDPLTGNRTENLISIEEYKNYFSENGFHFDVLPGFYNTHYPQKVINFVTPSINNSIKSLGEKALFLAPFIGLKGIRE